MAKRDNLDKFPVSYFRENIEFIEENIQGRLDKLNQKEYPARVWMRNYDFMHESVLEIIECKYSAGDPIEELSVILDEALAYRIKQNEFANILPDADIPDRVGLEEIREDYTRRQLKWLSFALCVGMGDKYIRQALGLISNAGLDALMDTIAVKLGDTDRPVSQNVAFKKRFQLLYDVIEADEQERPERMLKYLNKWYSLEDTPDFHLMDTGAYIGYWSWESALVTRLYNIDDTLFKTHEYYPDELVAFQL